jgi:hypothetical protein
MATIKEDYCSKEIYRLLIKKDLMEKSTQLLTKRVIHSPRKQRKPCMINLL